MFIHEHHLPLIGVVNEGAAVPASIAVDKAISNTPVLRRTLGFRWKPFPRPDVDSFKKKLVPVKS
jgi:hypothetical protein